MSKPILCLDFDGVCHQYTTKWQGAAIIPDRAVPGLFDFLESAKEFFDIQIFSTRSHQEGGTAAMAAWFVKERKLWREEGGKPEPDEPSNSLHLSFPTEKPPAYVGIDDRVITFDGTWPEVEFLRKFKPWNKRQPQDVGIVTVGFRLFLAPNGEAQMLHLEKDGQRIGMTIEQAKTLAQQITQRLGVNE